MLKTLKVRGFKSLDDVTLDFPRLTVLFGPNASGKSNILDAVQALSRFATSRTLADALAEPIRGYPVEAFSFPAGGLSELLSGPPRRFDLEADLDVGQDPFKYTVSVEIKPLTAALSVTRVNIPTEELRDFVAEDEKAPKAMLYPRDPSLDPQLVWKGKDEQDAAALEVPVVPIQEKVHPQALLENLRNTAKAGEPEPELKRARTRRRTSRLRGRSGCRPSTTTAALAGGRSSR
jgi:hypothetical protein